MPASSTLRTFVSAVEHSQLTCNCRYLFIDSDRPRYTIAMSAMAAFSAGVAICAWIMRIWLQKQNKTLRQKGSPTTYPY